MIVSSLLLPSFLLDYKRPQSFIGHGTLKSAT